MNIYDFDKTIYHGDCTLDFWRHCIWRHPIVLCAFPHALIAAACFHLRWCSRETFKEAFYNFLQYVPDVEREIQEFWKLHIQKIYPWYLEQKTSEDLVISASPDFLISTACTKLGIRWIASPVDIKTGKLLGPNCRGEEKVCRLLQAYPQTAVERVYSDSASDAPLAQLAERAYLVRHGKVCEWKNNG